MSYPLPTPIEHARPPVEFIEEVCGIYFRSIVINRGELVKQHTHDHDHATYCGAGSARVWVDGKWMQDVKAGHAVPILMGQEHCFQALEDGTRLACVHDVASATSIQRILRGQSGPNARKEG